jgi:molybdopterin synthase sulfur carrier subunit
MQVLYFGWVRQRIGLAKEEIDPPADVADVRTLIAWLKTRGPAYEAGLGNLNQVRVAVNQELTTLDAKIVIGDEVALFPPMTGG